MDEARHAALAWRILDWCQHEGGDPVRAAVFDALRALPDLAPASREGYPSVASDLRPHGILDEHRARALAKRVTRGVVRRIAMPRGTAGEVVA